MTDIDNFGTSWQGLTHGQVEDAIKAKVTQLDSTKLDDSSDVIQQLVSAASSAYHKEPTGIPKTDLAPSVQTSLGLADTALQAADKTQLQAAINAVQTALNNLMNGQNVTDAIDTFNEVVDFLNGIDTSDPTLFNQLKSLSDAIATLQSALSYKANSADVLNSLATKLGVSDVYVTTDSQGSFSIHIVDEVYTINMNHTHENMCKVVLCTQATLPQNKALDTIYAQVDNVSLPTTIEKLFIAGLEFEKGVPADTGQPYMISPTNGVTINLGENDGSGVSQQINVRGKNLTGALTLAVSAGLSLSDGQSSGSSLSIPLADALNGKVVTISYSGVGSLMDGTLTISQGQTMLSVANVVAYDALPSGYTRLEYVENAVRGIDTGILATNSDNISNTALGSTWEVDVQCNSAPSSNMMIVCTNEDIGHWFQVRADVQKFAVGGEGMRLSANVTERTVIEVSFYGNRITASAGGETVSRSYTYKNNYNVCLFANVNPNVSQYAGAQFTEKIYGVKCTSGGDFDAVPARRTSDNKVGLYDRANDVFYPLN